MENILEKKILESSKSETWICLEQTTIYIAFILY